MNKLDSVTYLLAAFGKEEESLIAHYLWLQIMKSIHGGLINFSESHCIYINIIVFMRHIILCILTLEDAPYW